VGRLLAVLATSAALAWSPLYAQDAAPRPEPDPAAEPTPAPAPVPEPTLEDLIPNEAVANPEGWAAQGVPAEAAAAEDAAPEVAPDSPIAELPEIDIPWPEQQELPQLAPLEPETDIQFADFDTGGAPPVAMGAEERISDELTLVFPDDVTLFPERDAFVDRFRALSTIESLDDAGNVARLGAQARADQTLIERLLRIYGYYDAQVYRSVAAPEAGEKTAERGPSVRFEIVPGTQYHFGEIDLGDLDDAASDYAMLRGQFEIQTGDPLLSDKIVGERYDLDTALGENGYPFAAINDPELLVDHARVAGDLTMPAMSPASARRLGRTRR
jgi:translocation and assembly module TamA